MNKAEKKALRAINQIALPKCVSIRRFWLCNYCGYKTIARKAQTCRDCSTKMKPGRII